MQRLASLALAIALTLPLSAFAETRSRGRTDLEKTIAELNAIHERRHDVVGPAVASTAFQQSIVDAMNRERARYGLRPLRLDARLSLAANDRANDMFAKHYFDHVSPDGINPFTWVLNRGYRYSIVGENLALGFRTSSAVVGGWMHSPGHRENILTSAFDEVGIAIGNGSPTRGYRGPLVVALYGAR
jgi:uncharacterized protein YkwD